LVEASSEAAATMVASSCERVAVVVNVSAEASSSVEADDTVSTISPTADSNPSAILIMSALRCWAAIWSCLTLASASSRAFCSALTLKVSTACAISPISSERPGPGSTIAKLPLASSIIAAVIADSGFETDRPMNNPAPNTETAISRTAISIARSIRSRSATFNLSASALMPLTDFDTSSMTGSTAAKDSDIAFNSPASFSACSIQAWKSR
jgi:hypothetical protein